MAVKIPVWSETKRGRVLSASAKFVFNSQLDTFELQLRTSGVKRAIDARDLLPLFEKILEDRKIAEKMRKKAKQAQLAEQMDRALQAIRARSAALAASGTQAAVAAPPVASPT